MLGVLDDKDAAGMLGRCWRVSERAWFTAPPSERALSPAALQSLARQLGFERVACEPTPARALAASAAVGARARRRGARDGLGYLVGELLGELGEAGSRGGLARSAAKGGLVNDDGPSVLTMIGAVALIVAS